MNTSENWVIVQLETAADSDYVTTVHWRMQLYADGDLVETYGSVHYPQRETDYVPYVELTPELVSSWVKDYLGDKLIAAMRSDLEKQLVILKQPKPNKPLPW